MYITQIQTQQKNVLSARAVEYARLQRGHLLAVGGDS